MVKQRLYAAVVFVSLTLGLPVLADDQQALIRTGSRGIHSREGDDCFRLGLNLVNLHKHKEAIEQFERAVELKPDMAGAWFNLSELYSAAGRVEEARRSLQSFLELVPAGTRADCASYQLKVIESIIRKGQSTSESDYLSQLEPCAVAKWPDNKKCLMVFIQPGENITGYKTGYKKELLDAFLVWSSALSGVMSFVYTDDLKNADVAVTWSSDSDNVIVKSESGDCRLFLKKGSRTIERAFIFVLTSSSGSGRETPMSLDLMFNVCLHEIGHALGIIGHSNNPADSMYFISLPNGKRQALSERDICTIKRLYGRGDRAAGVDFH